MKRVRTAAVVALSVGLAALMMVLAAGNATSSPDDGAAPTAKARAATPPPRPAPSECAPIPGKLDAGSEFRGRSARRARMCDPENLRPEAAAPTASSNVDATSYGRCTPPEGEGGCAPEVQVHTYPLCQRYLALYEEYPGPDGPRAHTRTSVRGVPAALFEDGGDAVMLEIYTGQVTVVVFAPDEATAMEVAGELRGRVGPRDVGARSDLPRPAPNATSGRPAC